ncbi:MAG: ROK family protein [Anaerolineae bacterium]|jgi:fructokinase
MTLYGGIEAGGTKFVCAVGQGPNEIHAQTEFPTTTPQETIARAIAFFADQPEPIVALGIGSFGPVDPDPRSPAFGTITTTPKPGWRDVDIKGRIQSALHVPVGFDTDVNAAALGEYRWGAAQDADTFVYITVGTGIGGGAMVAGNLLHGLVHPEMGHIRIPHDRERDPFAGICPFHGDCLEGLATGPAIEARWQQRGEDLPDDHPAWPLEAHYLALGLTAIICTLSPQRVILGGGVMQRLFLFPMIRSQVRDLLNGYIQAPAIIEQIDTYIVPPGLGRQAGVLGAIALAARAREDGSR